MGHMWITLLILQKRKTCYNANMKKQQNNEFETNEQLIKELEKRGMELVIEGSSKMSNFCKATAYGIANFYVEEAYPLSDVELKPFLKIIRKEFHKIFDPK